ncbi:MAG: hypothetical protein O7G88_03815 [bacterium]|nr:hypothetical protein [bacterium]
MSKWGKIQQLDKNVDLAGAALKSLGGFDQADASSIRRRMALVAAACTMVNSEVGEGDGGNDA